MMPSLSVSGWSVLFFSFVTGGRIADEIVDAAMNSREQREVGLAAATGVLHGLSGPTGWATEIATC